MTAAIGSNCYVMVRKPGRGRKALSDEEKRLIAQRMTAAREALGQDVSQERFAVMCGFPRREYVAKVEAGDNQVSTSFMQLGYAKGFGVSVEDVADYVAGRLTTEGFLARRPLALAEPLTSSEYRPSSESIDRRVTRLAVQTRGKRRGISPEAHRRAVLRVSKLPLDELTDDAIVQILNEERLVTPAQLRKRLRELGEERHAADEEERRIQKRLREDPEEGHNTAPKKHRRMAG